MKIVQYRDSNVVLHTPSTNQLAKFPLKVSLRMEMTTDCCNYDRLRKLNFHSSFYYKKECTPSALSTAIHQSICPIRKSSLSILECCRRRNLVFLLIHCKTLDVAVLNWLIIWTTSNSWWPTVQEFIWDGDEETDRYEHFGAATAVSIYFWMYIRYIRFSTSHFRMVLFILLA